MTQEWQGWIPPADTYKQIHQQNGFNHNGKGDIYSLICTQSMLDDEFSQWGVLLDNAFIKAIQESLV